MKDNSFDVIVVGGSVAGLSAAMTLVRSLRKVLVIDSKTPCNFPALHSQNFITNDGRPPLNIIERIKNELSKYETIDFADDAVTEILGENKNFEVKTKNGKVYKSKKILLATGLRDITPEIPGFSECWGRTILHCPYCHGYEYKNVKTAILANGEAAYHLGFLIDNWTKELTVLTNGISELRNEEAEKLAEKSIKVIESEIDRINHVEGKIANVKFRDGTEETFVAIYASIPFEQQSDLAQKLGCKMSSHGHIDVDDEQRTSIDGVYAAGDATAQQRAISVASASGTKSGFTINLDLTLK